MWGLLVGAYAEPPAFAVMVPDDGTVMARMSDPQPRNERPYHVDDEWSRAVLARRTGKVAEFLMPHLRPGMRLLDCGCGPGSITVDLAQAISPGEAIGIDVREEALTTARTLARDRGICNVTFRLASVYQLPFPDASFDAAFACALLQHLALPLEALKEMRRVLTPGGVIGIVDGSAPITFRYPAHPLLDAWDRIRVLVREYNTGRSWDPLRLRAVLREAGFALAHASGAMASEAGPPAGTPEDTRRVAQNHLIELLGMRGKLAVEQGWATQQELEQIAEALKAWGEVPDAFYGRPVFVALAWT
jgi:ubiquinone/menaquinone biosynthesis C-methylase UbiE